VDDNHDVLELLCDVLGQGYDLVMAIDGQEALTKFQQNDFDFIVTDVRMPKLSGIELAKEVRKISQLPILFITASEEELSAQIQGIDHVFKLKKPFRFKELQAKLVELNEKYFKPFSQAV